MFIFFTQFVEIDELKQLIQFPINPKTRWTILAQQISLISVLLSGCSLQTIDAEYYIGPVAFQYIAPPKGKAYVDQVMRFGIATEAGTNWGVTLGILERISVIPITVKSPQFTSINESQASPWSLFAAPLINDWKLSLFYLCIERHADDYFLYRSVYGAELVVGMEISNLSLGAVRRTVFKPPDNAFSSLHFKSNHPMQAQARVWIDEHQSNNFPPELLEEITK